MAANQVIVNCPDLPVVARDKCLRFPGGVEICPNLPDLVPNGTQIASSILSQANAALAPLSPIFTIIEVVIAIMEVLKAIPKAISQLSPSPILSALSDAIKAAAKLLKLLPVLSIPSTVYDLISCVIDQLKALQIELGRLLSQSLKITAARADAVGNVPLIALIDCAEGNLNVQFLNMKERYEPLLRLVSIINDLLDLIGLPPLPLVQLGDSIEEALEIIDPLVSTLESARDAIPLAC